MWASSGLTLPIDHAALSATLLSAALDGKTLGEATLAAKQAVTDPSARAVARKSSAFSVPTTTRSSAAGCGVPGAPVAGPAPFVLSGLALSMRRRRSGN